MIIIGLNLAIIQIMQLLSKFEGKLDMEVKQGKKGLTGSYSSSLSKGVFWRLKSSANSAKFCKINRSALGPCQSLSALETPLL